MPTYEYKCSNCGNQFEIFQSIKDEPLMWCSDCGKDSLKKLISIPAGLIFKGTGFYLTDYKNNKGDLKSSNVNPQEKKANKQVKKETKKIKKEDT